MNLNLKVEWILCFHLTTSIRYVRKTQYDSTLIGDSLTIFLFRSSNRFDIILYIYYMFFNCLEKHRSVDIIKGNKILVKEYSSRWVQVDGDCLYKDVEQIEINCDTDVSIEFLT